MLTALIIMSVIGWLINFGILIYESGRAVEGAMGFGSVILLSFIPFSLPVLYWITRD